MSGFSQKEVAQILGFTHESRISKWEQGIGIPGSNNLLKLSILYKAPFTLLYPELIQDMTESITEKVQIVRAELLAKGIHLPNFSDMDG